MTRAGPAAAVFWLFAAGHALAQEPPVPDGQAEPAGVTVYRDILFTDGFLLDIHAPDRPGGSPAVVTLHGASGGKTSMNLFVEGLAAAGYTVFNAEWLAPDRPLSAAAAVRSFEAAACALRFAGAHAVEYGAVEGPLVVVGKSAGGLGGAVATLAPDEFSGGCETPGPDPAVSLFIGLEGQYVGATTRGGFAAAAREDPSLVERLDPRSYLDRAGELRVVLFLGDQLPRAVAPAEEFLEALQHAGVTAEIRRVTGPHDAETFTDGVLELLAESFSGAGR